MSKTRILILTARIGDGHRSAALALAAALDRFHGELCDVAIANPIGDPDAPALLRALENQARDVPVQAPWLDETVHRLGVRAGPAGLGNRSLGLALYPAVAPVLDAYRPHVVVATHSVYHQTMVRWRSRRAQRVPLATVVTDLAEVIRQWFHPALDSTLVPTEAVAQRAYACGLRKPRVLLTGLPVNLALAEPPPAKRVARQALGWEPDRFTLLVAGSLGTAGLEAYLQRLNACEQALQIVVVAGRDADLEHRSQATAWRHPAHTYGFVHNMPEIMRASDAVLTKAGGLITAEALAAHLPLLIMRCNAPREVGNAAYVVDQGAGDLVLAPEQLLPVLQRWLAEDGRLFHERVSHAVRLGRPHAAQTAARAVMRLAADREAGIPHPRWSARVRQELWPGPRK